MASISDPADGGANRGPARVFLSHTSELRTFPANRSFVAAAEAAVTRAGHAVIDMAYFTARDSASADYCAARVADAQVYVGIVGLRYGAPVRDRQDLSYTELEFETATRLGLTRLIFLARADAISSTDQPGEHVARQEAFRQRLQKEAGISIAWISSPAELELGLFHALVELAPTLKATAAATQTLPRDVASFTGRGKELEQLLAAASATARSGRVVGISAIDGMAGVGKTALAVHAAHRLAPEFPDGQLFLDLHAHTAGQRPVTSADALANLLLTTGVAAQLIPHDIDARAAMWRDRLAGKRMLILLDDAASHEQVRPLLPGVAGCLVLITSRRRLAALEDIEPLTLGTLPPAHAVELFARLAGAGSRDPDPAATNELVELCGYLPLAIRLLAGRLRSHANWTARYLVNMLQDAQDRLAEMRVENRAIDIAFNHSYLDLPAEQQRLFRRLGLHPGSEIDAYAAAALDGIDLAQARRRLDALFNDHLIDEPLPGRYRLHDLIRAYARDLASRDDLTSNDTAVDRLLDYYLHVTTIADRHFARRSDPTVPPIAHPPARAPDLSTRQEALAWLEGERSNLVTCLHHAAMHGRHMHAVQLARATHSFLSIAGHLDQAETVQRTALTAARLTGDRRGRAGALQNLSFVQQLTGDWAAATVSLTEALTLYRDLGDRLGQANVLNHLGRMQQLTGAYRAATVSLTEGLTLFGDLGDRLGQANALTDLAFVQQATGEYRAAMASLTEALALFHDLAHLASQAPALTYYGIVHQLTGDPTAATASLNEALALSRDLGQRHNQAIALISLGFVQIMTCDYPAATASLTEALSLSRDLGYQFGRANALIFLGAVHYRTGRYRDATDSLSQALSLSCDLGYRFGQASALNDLGVVHYLTGEHERATDLLTGALALIRDVGHRHGEAEVLNCLGVVQHLTAEYPAALASLTGALTLSRDLGYRKGEVVALNNIGALLLDSGGTHESVNCHRQALDLARAIHTPLEEGRALEGIGRCLIRARAGEEGAAHLRQALEIYQRIGAPETEQVQATLIQLCERLAE